MSETFYRPVRDGFDLFIRLTPKSSREAVEGVEIASDGRAHLKVRVRAVPEKGKANQALVKLLAATLGVPARDVEIVSGDTARLKSVRITSNADDIEERIRSLAG